ncbi:MAG: hypothetical protein IK095_04705 [Oscillospiraceae bacterium]|nr:hypothetical protein [Oscillospiraceae bacterium]
MDLAEHIERARACLDRFDYDHYQRDFAEISAAVAPFFDALPEDPAPYAGELLRQLAERRAALPRAKREMARLQDRQVLALYLGPASRKHGERAEALLRELARLWAEERPREAWVPGDYEQILSGFDRDIEGWVRRLFRWIERRRAARRARKAR